jgi:hypothetical protein
MAKHYPLLPLLLTLATLAPVLAQESAPSIEYTLVLSSRPPKSRLMDNATWAREAGQAKVLDRASCATNWGRESYTFMGRKLPITFFDPRAEASQVQYTDVGFKMECKPRQRKDGRIDLELRMERSQLLEANARNAFVAESSLVVGRGQTAVLATTHGLATSTYLGTVYPGQTMSEDSTIMMVVTVR